MKHKLINNKKEFVKWAKNVKTEDIYGNEEESDDRLVSHLLKNSPDMYPAIVVYAFEKGWDRTGKTETQLCDYVYLSEFTDGYNPNRKKDELKVLEKKLEPYFIALEEYNNLRHSEHDATAFEAKLADVLNLRREYKAEIELYFENKYGKNWRLSSFV